MIKILKINCLGEKETICVEEFIVIFLIIMMLVHFTFASHL